MDTKNVITGQCLCGKVRYEISGSLLYAHHCHCSMCRRQHGAAFATYADFKPGTFRWVSGEELIKNFETASGAGWCFCRECGSTLAGADNGRINSVTLGTVQSNPGIKPGAHIFTGSKACWYDITDDLPRFTEWPEN